MFFMLFLYLLKFGCYYKYMSCYHQSLPVNLLPYLYAKGSLTALLEQVANQPLRVDRVFEGFEPLSLIQKRQLGFVESGLLSRPMMAWNRLVWLYGDDDEPWVSAQSVFPLIGLQGDAKRLKHLKNTPIGYVLFKRQTALPNSRVIMNTQQGWQRQTSYDWYGRPLLITETFLPVFQKRLLAR